MVQSLIRFYTAADIICYNKGTIGANPAGSFSQFFLLGRRLCAAEWSFK